MWRDRHWMHELAVFTLVDSNLKRIVWVSNTINTKNVVQFSLYPHRTFKGIQKFFPTICRSPHFFLSYQMVSSSDHISFMDQTVFLSLLWWNLIRTWLLILIIWSIIQMIQPLIECLNYLIMKETLTHSSLFLYLHWLCLIPIQTTIRSLKQLALMIKFIEHQLQRRISAS